MSKPAKETPEDKRVRCAEATLVREAIRWSRVANIERVIREERVCVAARRVECAIRARARARRAATRGRAGK